MTERERRLEEIALQPKVVEVDGQRMENHSLPPANFQCNKCSWNSADKYFLV